MPLTVRHCHPPPPTQAYASPAYGYAHASSHAAHPSSSTSFPGAPLTPPWSSQPASSSLSLGPASTPVLSYPPAPASHTLPSVRHLHPGEYRQRSSQVRVQVAPLTPPEDDTTLPVPVHVPYTSSSTTYRSSASSSSSWSAPMSRRASSSPPRCSQPYGSYEQCEQEIKREEEDVGIAMEPEPEERAGCGSSYASTSTLTAERVYHPTPSPSPSPSPGPLRYPGPIQQSYPSRYSSPSRSPSREPSRGPSEYGSPIRVSPPSASARHQRTESYEAVNGPHEPPPDAPPSVAYPPAEPPLFTDVLAAPSSSDGSAKGKARAVDWLDFARERSAHVIAEKMAEMVCWVWFAEELPSSSGFSASTEGRTRTPPPPPSSLQLVTTAAYVGWLRKVLETTQVSQSVIVLALHYVWRLRQAQAASSSASSPSQTFSHGQHPRPQAQAQAQRKWSPPPGSEVRVTLLALLLANKFLDDNTYTNRTWADVSGFGLGEVNRMEGEFLRGVGWGLAVGVGVGVGGRGSRSPGGYEQWGRVLRGLVWAKERAWGRVREGDRRRDERERGERVRRFGHGHARDEPRRRRECGRARARSTSPSGVYASTCDSRRRTFRPSPGRCGSGVGDKRSAGGLEVDERAKKRTRGEPAVSASVPAISRYPPPPSSSAARYPRVPAPPRTQPQPAQHEHHHHRQHRPRHPPPSSCASSQSLHPSAAQQRSCSRSPNEVEAFARMSISERGQQGGSGAGGQMRMLVTPYPPPLPHQASQPPSAWAPSGVLGVQSASAGASPVGFGSGSGFGFSMPLPMWGARPQRGRTP